MDEWLQSMMSDFKRVGDRWIRAPKPGSKKAKSEEDKYEDNKWRAVLAMNNLLPEYDHGKHTKTDDLADALLQGLWVVWMHIAPRAPARKRTRARAPTDDSGGGSGTRSNPSVHVVVDTDPEDGDEEEVVEYDDEAEDGDEDADEDEPVPVDTDDGLVTGQDDVCSVSSGTLTSPSCSQ